MRPMKERVLDLRHRDFIKKHLDPLRLRSLRRGADFDRGVNPACLLCDIDPKPD